MNHQAEHMKWDNSWKYTKCLDCWSQVDLEFAVFSVNSPLVSWVIFKTSHAHQQTSIFGNLALMLRERDWRTFEREQIIHDTSLTFHSNIHWTKRRLTIHQLEDKVMECALLEDRAKRRRQHTSRPPPQLPPSSLPWKAWTSLEMV